MSLELATAFIRVRTDRAQLRSEVERTRAFITKRLSGITVPVKLSVNTAGLDRLARDAGARVGRQFNQAAATASRSAATPRASGGAFADQFAASGMLSTGRHLNPRLALETHRNAMFSRQLASALAMGGQRFATGPSGGVFAGLGQLDQRQFQNRMRLLQQSNALGAGRGGGGAGGTGGGGGQRGGFFAMRPGMMGTAGRFATGVGFAASPMLTAGMLMGNVPMAAGMAAGMGAVGGVRAFGDFEQEMRRVQVVQKESGATPQQLEMLENQARELGRSTIFSASEAAQAMVLLSQRGFDALQVYEQMPNVLNLAAAGQLDIADAAGVVGAVQKQFGKEAKDTTEIVDILSKAYLNSATDVRELGLSLSFVGPLAKLTGKDLQETVAALMLLRDAGLDSSRAGTGLTRIMTKLAESKVQDKFKAIGVEVIRVDGSMKSLSEIVRETSAAMEKLTAPQRTAFAIDAFGQRGGPAFGALIEQGFERLNENFAMLNDHMGTSGRVADDMMSTMNSQLKQLGDSAKDLGIEFGNTFGPPLTSLFSSTAQGLRNVSDAMRLLRNSTPGGGAPGGQQRPPRRMPSGMLEGHGFRSTVYEDFFSFFGLGTTGREQHPFTEMLKSLKEIDAIQARDPGVVGRKREIEQARRKRAARDAQNQQPQTSASPEFRQRMQALHEAGLVGDEDMRRAGIAVGGGPVDDPTAGGFDPASHQQRERRKQRERQQQRRSIQSSTFEALQNLGLGELGGLAKFAPDLPELTRRGLLGFQGLNAISPGILGPALGLGAVGVGATAAGRIPVQEENLRQSRFGGIFGIEEFQRQIQKQVLGPDDADEKTAKHTEKIEKNTGKGTDFLQEIANGIKDFAGLG